MVIFPNFLYPAILHLSAFGGSEYSDFSKYANYTTTNTLAFAG